MAELEAKITELLQEGWKCQGGVSVSISPESNNTWYAQSMIKEEAKEKSYMEGPGMFFRGDRVIFADNPTKAGTVTGHGPSPHFDILVKFDSPEVLSEQPGESKTVMRTWLTTISKKDPNATP